MVIIRLETQRLILRKPKSSDWKDIVEGAGDIRVSSQTGQMPFPYKKKDALSWIRQSIKKWGKESYAFAIELKSEGKMIGVIDVHGIDNFNEKATTGSWINPKYQRKGYITEAKIAANNFAFDKLKLRKLKSKVFTDNKASNTTQKNIGYRLEGLSKSDIKCKATGKIHDDYIYGLFKEDWKKNLPKIKKRLADKIKKLETTKK